MPRSSVAKKNTPKTTAQRLDSIVKSARQIMRKDKGLNGDLDRLPMLTWIMFLKFLDDLERLHEDEAALAGDRNRILRAAVDSLPEHYRLVMLMFYFEELSVEQISRALDVSVSAVKVRLHRGRDRLATKLEASL